MRNLKKNRFMLTKSLLVSICTFVFIIGILIAGTNHFSTVNQEQELALTEQAIRKAVLQCYAIEGRYPSELAYLTEHYGLLLDEKKYRISYDCFASNIMPEIYVFER